MLPVPPRLGVYPGPLLVAAGLGLLVALLFALPALARARSVAAATLLRDALARAARPSVTVLTAMAALLLCLVALAVLTASDRAIALVDGLSEDFHFSEQSQVTTPGGTLQLSRDITIPSVQYIELVPATATVPG